MGEVRILVFSGSLGLFPSVTFKSGDHSSGAALTTQSRFLGSALSLEGPGEYYIVEDRRGKAGGGENHLIPAPLSGRGEFTVLSCGFGT